MVKNLPASAGDAGDVGLNLGLGRSQEDPLEKGTVPTPVFLSAEFHGHRSLVGYSPWGCKELDRTERLSFYLAYQELA